MAWKSGLEWKIQAELSYRPNAMEQEQLSRFEHKQEMARYYVVADGAAAGSSFGFLVMFCAVVMSVIIIIPVIIFACGDSHVADDGKPPKPRKIGAARHSGATKEAAGHAVATIASAAVGVAVAF
nr:hypothetical protein BC332_19730 [Ipomoea batatas]